MQTASLIQSVIALGFVLALILAIAWLVRRYGIDKNWHVKTGDKQRLQLVERLTIDPRRQLVLVRRDDKEHLLMLGQNEALIVETYEKDTQE